MAHAVYEFNQKLSVTVYKGNYPVLSFSEHLKTPSFSESYQPVEIQLSGRNLFSIIQAKGNILLGMGDGQNC
jgi:hypothetical protein